MSYAALGAAIRTRSVGRRRRVLIGGKPMTLAGIAAQEFFGETIRPDPAAVWLPLGQEPYVRGAASLLARPDQDWLYAIGRLNPGAHGRLRRSAGDHRAAELAHDANVADRGSRKNASASSGFASRPPRAV